MTLDVTVSLVNHANPRLLRDCLASLPSAGCRVGVTVVDNAAAGRMAVPELAAAFPEVRWTMNPQAKGFGHNHNLVLAAFLRNPAAGRYVCVLNDDTVLHHGCLKLLAAYLDANPRVGVVGPSIINQDASPQDSAFYAPTPWQLFVGAALLPRKLNAFKRAIYVDEEAQSATQPHEAEWLLGACLLVRREALEQVGFFDEILSPRANVEDVDWCMRFRREGWRVVRVPGATMTHIGGQTLNSDATSGAWVPTEICRVYLGLMHKHFGFPTALATRFVFIAAGLWNLGMLTQGRVRRRISGCLLRRQLLDAWKLCFGLPFLNRQHSLTLSNF